MASTAGPPDSGEQPGSSPGPPPPRKCTHCGKLKPDEEFTGKKDLTKRTQKCRGCRQVQARLVCSRLRTHGQTTLTTIQAKRGPGRIVGTPRKASPGSSRGPGDIQPPGERPWTRPLRTLAPRPSGLPHGQPAEDSTRSLEGQYPGPPLQELGPRPQEPYHRPTTDGDAAPKD